ncbi:MAG: sigma-70 family RNA polymerase sigma factor [Actinobacteria bacterium]|nr:sigma-70 family RNA polymerase sigma factor [Actinomycetota bacterium]
MSRAATDTEIARARDLATRIARRVAGPNAREGLDVEDAVQEVLMSFMQLDLDEVHNPDAWIVTATRRKCLDFIKAAERHRQVPIGLGGFDDDWVAARARATGLSRADITVGMAVYGPSAAAVDPMMLTYALRDLSEREKRLLLRHAQGWTNSEIAEEYGYASAQSAAVAISRARRKLRDRFDSSRKRGELLNPQRLY